MAIFVNDKTCKDFFIFFLGGGLISPTTMLYIINKDLTTLDTTLCTLSWIILLHVRYYLCILVLFLCFFLFAFFLTKQIKHHKISLVNLQTHSENPGYAPVRYFKPPPPQTVKIYDSTMSHSDGKSDDQITTLSERRVFAGYADVLFRHN